MIREGLPLLSWLQGLGCVVNSQLHLRFGPEPGSKTGFGAFWAWINACGTNFILDIFWHTEKVPSRPVIGVITRNKIIGGTCPIAPQPLKFTPIHLLHLRLLPTAVHQIITLSSPNTMLCLRKMSLVCLAITLTFMNRFWQFLAELLLRK